MFYTDCHRTAHVKWSVLQKVQGHRARQRREIDSSHRLFWSVSVGIS